MQTDFWKKIWNRETICNNTPWIIFQIKYSNWIYLASKLVKKRKIGRENFFLQNVCGFCREKNSKTSGWDGKSFGHLVQPVQRFESSKFRHYWSTLTCYISWLVFFERSQVPKCYSPVKHQKTKWKNLTQSSNLTRTALYLLPVEAFDTI